MEGLFCILSAAPDYRKGNHLVYPLDNILLVSFTALMSGYKTWRQFELYAQQHKDDLRREYTKYARRELSMDTHPLTTPSRTSSGDWSQRHFEKPLLTG